MKDNPERRNEICAKNDLAGLKDSQGNRPAAPSPLVPARTPLLHDGSGWLLSGAVARRLGIQTGTLKKWRSLGRGPVVWKRVSKTVVVYLASSVTEFERTWGESFAKATNSYVGGLPAN
jgi:hypothetical protein